MLGIAGAACGFLFALGAMRALLSLVPKQFPRWVHFTLDARVLWFVVAITVGTTLLVGIVPALSASRFNLAETLKESSRSASSGGAKARFRSMLVIAEVAMSVMLLTGAGLMIQTFRKLMSEDAGFRPQGITTLQTSAPGNTYSTGAAKAQLVRNIRKELSSLPGVVSVAAATAVPLLDSWGRSFTADGRPALGLKDAPFINHVVVTPGYFKTMGIPILAGRDFTEDDAKKTLVTIIDAGLAKRYWPGESALGKRVRYGPPENNEPWHTVVGVVGEARNQSLRELRSNSVYLPYGEFEFASLSYLVQTAGAFPNAEKTLRAGVARVDRNVAVSRVIELKDVVANSIWQERFVATLFTAFGLLAFLLALVGLYGVMAHAVSLRVHEMGIRMALGASAGGIRKMVMLQSGRLAVCGLVIGIVAALGVARLMKSQLYEVSASDPMTFGAVVVLLAVAAVMASYFPARRATRVDPILALRAE